MAVQRFLGPNVERLRHGSQKVGETSDRSKRMEVYSNKLPAVCGRKSQNHGRKEKCNNHLLKTEAIFSNTDAFKCDICRKECVLQESCYLVTSGRINSGWVFRARTTSGTNDDDDIRIHRVFLLSFNRYKLALQYISL